MSNLFRPTNEPCKCARCGCSRQMPNRAPMPEPRCPAEASLSYMGSQNYQRSSIAKGRCCRRQRSDFAESYQDFPQKNEHQNFVQEYPEQLPGEHQDCESCVRHHSPRIHGQGSQQQQQPNPPPQPLSPSQSSCTQRYPKFCCQDDCARECCSRKRRSRKGRRRKMYYTYEYVVTHEVGVQTEDVPWPAIKSPSVEFVEVIDLTTQEKEVRHRRGDVETVVSEVQSVMVIPIDGTKITKEYTQSHTSLANEDDKRILTHFKEDEVDPESVVIPSRAMLPSELEPMLSNLKASDVAGFSSPTEKDHRIYRTNATYEHDYGQKSRKTMTQTIFDDPKEQKGSSSPSPTRSPVRQPPKSRAPSGKDITTPSPTKKANKNFGPNKALSSKKKDKKNIESNSDDRTVANLKVHKPTFEDFDNVSTVHMKVTNRKETVSKKRGRDSVHKKAVYESRISELLVMDPIDENEGQEGKDGKDEKEGENGEDGKEGEDEDTEPKLKPKPNPKPKQKPNPNPKSKPKLKPKPKPKPESELEPEPELEPELEPVGEPERNPNMSKCKRVPKMEIKFGYPTEDMVCRMHGPPRQQVVAPRSRGTGQVRGCFSCFAPRPGVPYPTCSPLPRQCDIIYGFGSMPAAYYCH